MSYLQLGPQCGPFCVSLISSCSFSTGTFSGILYLPENPHSTTPSRWAGLHFHRENRSHQMSSISCLSNHRLPSFPTHSVSLLLQLGTCHISCSGFILLSALNPFWLCLLKDFYPLIVSFLSYKSNLFIFTGSFLLTCKHV